MSVIIKTRDDVLRELLEGMDSFVNVLKVTFGPRGRYVLMKKSGENPKFTRTGSEAADGFELAGIYRNLGAKLIRSVAESAHSSAGDGSVMATLIAIELMRSFTRLVQAGHSIIDLTKGLKAAAAKAEEMLRASATPLKTQKQIENLLTTQTGGDRWVVDPIVKVQKKLGTKGAVTFGYSDGIKTEIIFRKGLSFDESYLSPHFDDPNSESSELGDPLILITMDKITDMEELLNLTEKIAELDKPLLIIADGIGEDALSLLLINKNSGVLNAIAVKAPGFGDRRIDELEDIAAFTGTQVFGRHLGRKMSEINVGDLGGASKVRVERSRTIIIGGKGSKSRINKRLGELNKRLANEKDDYEKQTMETRIAKFNSGVANIRIGGYTESEKILKRLQVTRAYSALRAGVESGFVPGGGVALLKAADGLVKCRPEKAHLPAFKALASALTSPFLVLADNSNAKGDYLEEKIKESSFKSGFNAVTGKIEKLSSWNIIDSLGMVLSSVDSAVGFAVNMLSTEMFITETPYVVGHDEAPMLGLKGYKGMQGIKGMEHDHE